MALIQLALAAVAVLAIIADAYLGARGAAMFLCTAFILHAIRTTYTSQLKEHKGSMTFMTCGTSISKSSTQS